MEWALTGIAPTVNFTTERLLYSILQGQRFWAAERGTNDYAVCVRSNMPQKIVVYGSAALNAFFLALPQEVQPMLTHARPAAAFPQAMLQPGNALGYPTGDQLYHDQLRVLQPCRVPTFDWATNTVLIPQLLAQDVGQQWAVFLNGLNGVLPSVGLDWQSAPLEPVLEYGNADDDDVFNMLDQMDLGDDAPAPPPNAHRIPAADA